MELVPTAIADVIMIEPRVFADERGHFLETWEERKFTAAGLTLHFRQDNENRSRRHVLRGLHYQLRKPQGKLVRVVCGSVLDVVVDLRRSSHTFGRWVSTLLSGENHRMLWVPPGFAHGFFVLSDSAHFLYKCTEFYAPEDEHAIAWDDPDLAIDWQLPREGDPVLSDRDRNAGRFRDAEYFP